MAVSQKTGGQQQAAGESDYFYHVQLAERSDVSCEAKNNNNSKKKKNPFALETIGLTQLVQIKKVLDL